MSCEGHLKITARSNELKTVENSLFCCFLLQLCSLKMPMMDWNWPRPQHGPISKHPRGYRGIIRFWGFLPQPPPQITLASPQSMAVPTIFKNRCMPYLDQWPVGPTSDISIWPETKYTWWHGLGLGFIGELLQGHGKVILRSQQGQISWKWLKIA